MKDNLLAIVYNLYELEEGIFLPNAYVVKQEADGVLTHMVQKATLTTLPGLGLKPTSNEKNLLDLIEQLQPAALEKKYNASRKKPLALAALLEEEEIKKNLLGYIHRRLDQLLTEISRKQLPLTWDIERKVLVKNFLVKIHPNTIEPVLNFRRTPEGVHYRLRWSDGKKTKTFSSFNELHPITNHPAWIMADYQLYRIAHINGNMVKPFRQKDELFIPQNSTATYFRKFIVKVASQVDIQADGFEIEQHSNLLHARIEAVRHIFNDIWVLQIQMVYPNAYFDWRNQREKRTSLEILGEEIKIISIKRDKEAEDRQLALLQSFGLQNTEAGYFEPIEKTTDDPFYVINWLSNHKQKLNQAGFEVALPEWEGQTINLSVPQISLNPQQENDWFDIHGEVVIGNFTIPFLAIARYIKDNNRFYPLPNGEIFLIPLEWMHRYQALAQFARKGSEGLRLARSQYTLLEEIGLATLPTSENSAVDYIPPSTLKAELRPYQLEGVRWLIGHFHNQLGACLADDMGLGKTLQTIALLLYAKDQKPREGTGNTTQLDLFSNPGDFDFLQPLRALLIMPASLVYNWEREIRRFAPSLSIYNHTGPRRHTDARLLNRFDIILTTYQTALRDEKLLGQIEFEYIVLDESQQIKNRESKIFKSVSTLNARHKLSLSGTPIENALADLWSQMQFINPELLGSFPFFKQTFIGPIEKQNDETSKDRLRSLVQPYLLRRTKEEVAPDLPPLTTQLFYSEMTPEQKKRYEKEKSAARNLLLDHFQADNPQFRFQVLQSLTRLRQIANHPVLAQHDFEGESGKFTDVLEQWEVIRKSGHKVLIFSSFVQYLDLFRQNFEHQGLPYSWLTGDLDSKRRTAAIEKFESQATVQSFLISIKAGGAGLNLTAADYVFILDPWWNPATEQQAIARAHRIGQDKHVFAIKFIAKESIEEKILLLQEKKAQLAEDIIGETGKLAWSRDELAFLLA